MHRDFNDKLMEKMENPAKEILRKYLPEPNNQAEVNDDINIIKAMEDYATAKLKNIGVIGDVIETKGQLAILMIETYKKIADIQEGGLGDNDDALIDALIGKYEKYEEEYSSL